MTMQRVALQLLALGVVVGWLASAPAADDKAASATGTWKSSFTTQNGQTIETTYKLKQDGDKLTGTVTGRDGKEVEIENGKVKDGEASFDVTRERDGQKFVLHYKGKVGADAIEGKVEFEANGEARSRDWKATRQGADKGGK
jgi:hypothetical protein